MKHDKYKVGSVGLKRIRIGKLKILIKTLVFSSLYLHVLFVKSTSLWLAIHCH